VQLLNPRDDMIFIYMQLNIESSLFSEFTERSFCLVLKLWFMFGGTVDTLLIPNLFASTNM